MKIALLICVFGFSANAFAGVFSCSEYTTPKHLSSPDILILKKIDAVSRETFEPNKNGMRLFISSAAQQSKSYECFHLTILEENLPKGMFQELHQVIMRSITSNIPMGLMVMKAKPYGYTAGHPTDKKIFSYIYGKLHDLNLYLSSPSTAR